MPSSPEPSDSAGYYERGKERFNRGEFGEARYDFEKALDLNSSNVPALTGFAAVLVETGHHDEALQRLNDALRLDPSYAKAHLNRGCLLDRRGERAAAIEDFSAAIRCDPTFALGYLNRGIALEENGCHESAFADFCETIRLDPGNVFAYRSRGALLAGQNRFEEAIADFTSAVKLAPESADIYCERGAAFFNREDFARAEADFSAALRIDSGHVPAYHWRGLVYQQTDRYAEAIADYSAVLQHTPDSAEIYADRGVIFYNKEDYVRAEADYTQALRLEPNNVTTLLWRAMLFGRLGRHDDAIADSTSALNCAPDRADIYTERAAEFQSQGNLARAEADYCEAIRLNPANADAFHNRGQLKNVLKHYDDAYSDFTEAVRLDPDSAARYVCRGHVLWHLDEFDEAIDNYSTALRLNPSASEAFRSRGELRRWLGEDDEALADLNEAIRLDPANADAYYGRGRIWQDRDEFARAVADFDEALRLNPEYTAVYRHRGAAWDDLGEQDKAESDFDEAFRLESKEEEMPERKPVHTLLQNHFAPTDVDSVTITERKFPYRVRVDLQRAVDELLHGPLKVAHFSGVRKRHSHEGINFTDLLVRDRNDPALCVPPQYEDIDIGEEAPVRCLKEGLWLLEHNLTKLAVLLTPARNFHQVSGLLVQVATLNDEDGTRLTDEIFKRLEQAVADARSYRGKVLSLESRERYSGEASGITVHRLHTVDRDQVILPRKTLDLLERNLLGFVRRREQLARYGLPTKKGLLFYGPPGTGKTHTIHYLAAALKGHTTLLISAEQVGALGEYMTLARLLQPTIVVIEDADLIARDRSQMGTCEEVLLNKLLNEMDGLRENADILFILTTNRPEALEAALSSRPGRIDQAIEFPFPDDEGREKLVRLYSRGVLVPDDVVGVTIKRTKNVSAAFIKELMRRATQFHLEREGSTGIALEDVENALEEMLFSGGSLNRKLLGGQVGESVEV